MRRVFTLICIAFLSVSAQQPEKPDSFFLQEKVKIGEPVKLALVYKHASETEVIFPDSAYRFAPFEFISKEVFPTKTIQNISTDSAVYLLRTFDIEQQQTLNLPVYILQGADTLVVSGIPASIQLQEVVKQIPQPLTFKENTVLQRIKTQFNYPNLILGLVLFGLFAGGIWYVFRKKLLMRYRLYVLKKNHRNFIYRYNIYIDRFHKSISLSDMEKAITLWKNYLTGLEDTAINSFTTKEIVSYYDNDEDVTTALKLFDRAIYGNILSDKISDTLTAFYLLHHFADRRYDIIKENTRNAANAR